MLIVLEKLQIKIDVSLKIVCCTRQSFTIRLQYFFCFTRNLIETRYLVHNCKFSQTRHCWTSRHVTTSLKLQICTNYDSLIAKNIFYYAFCPHTTSYMPIHKMKIESSELGKPEQTSILRWDLHKYNVCVSHPCYMINGKLYFNALLIVSC